MRVKLIYSLIALASLAAGLATQRWLANLPPPAPIVEPPLHDLDGQMHSLSEWRGQVVVLNFWATWCPPCREEMPEFVRLQQELEGRGLRFVGVAIDDPAEVADYLKAHPVNYPILIGGEGAPEWADRLGNRLSALPFSAVFDRVGRLVHTQTGIFDREQVLEVVRPLLEASAAE
jgi:thiol-disulfide isomerase/thioredoxin